MKSRLCVRMAICQVAMLVPVALRADLILNGSFESPTISGNLNFVGAFSFDGWSAFSTGGGGNAGIVDGLDFGLAPYDGNQHFSFNGNDPAAGSWIEQSFSTVAGQTYAVEFAVGRNNGFAAQVLQIEGEVFGASDGLLASFSGAPPESIGYQLATFQFTADSSTSRLRFTDTSGSNPNTDLFLDSVAVTAVPDVADTAVLLLVALAAAGAARRVSR